MPMPLPLPLPLPKTSSRPVSGLEAASSGRTGPVACRCGSQDLKMVMPMLPLVLNPVL
ncbi:hypothetical protein RKD29_002769 [Streptomyces tendae]